MPNEFPSRKRPRSEMRTGSKSSRSPSHYQDDYNDDWSDESQSDRDNSWHSHHHKRQRLRESRSPSRRPNDLRRSRIQLRKHSSRTSEREKPKKMLEGIKQGEKWEDGGIVKKVGRGWFVVEDSTDSEMASSRQTPQASDKPAEASPPEQVSSRKRKRSEPPESIPPSTKRIHVDVASKEASEPGSGVTQEKRLRLVMAQIATIIRKDLPSTVGPRKPFLIPLQVKQVTTVPKKFLGVRFRCSSVNGSYILLGFLPSASQMSSMTRLKMPRHLHTGSQLSV